MSPIAFGVVAALAFLQASIAAPRQDFSDCLKKASVQASEQKVAPDQYSAFAMQQCSAAGASFKSALVAFDVKNGVKRAQAVADAQLQIDDYLATSVDKYGSKPIFAKAPPAPSSTPATTPAPVPAAAQAEPKSD